VIFQIVCRVSSKVLPIYESLSGLIPIAIIKEKDNHWPMAITARLLADKQLVNLYEKLAALCKNVCETGSVKATKSRRKASVKKPAAKKPAAKETVAKKPTAMKLGTKKPGAMKPAAKKAVAKKPAAKKKPGKKS